MELLVSFWVGIEYDAFQVLLEVGTLVWRFSHGLEGYNALQKGIQLKS